MTDALSQSAYMAVLDIKAAYRSVNIRPAHKTYQAFEWVYNG